MDSLVYSLNATVPVFLVILVGYYLKQRKMLNEDFINTSNKLNFKVTLPALLMQDISHADIRDDFDIRFLLYCILVTTFCFFVIWGMTKVFMKDRTMTGAFVQASFRGSAAVLGVAFIQNMYGTTGMAPLMIIGCVPLYNIFSVIVLTLESPNHGKSKFRKTLYHIVTNPIILGIAAGLILSGFSIRMPSIIDKTIGNFAKIATPLALITIGAGFEGKQALAKMKPTVIASFIKLILQPLLFLPMAMYMGFTDEKLIAILIMLGAPTTVSCYIMAKNMDNDGVLTSSIIVLTTALSAVTLTGWIFLLRYFNFI